MCRQIIIDNGIDGILVDDEKQNRDAWDLGITIDATQNIIKALWELVK